MGAYREIKILTEERTALESWDLDSNPVLSDCKAWAPSTATLILYCYGNVLICPHLPIHTLKGRVVIGLCFLSCHVIL